MQPDPDLVNSLCRNLNCHPITATMLINREFRTPEDATLFLKANLADIRSPFQILGMEEAVQRIYTAIYKKEKILIFGDYDVDGVTSTVILLDFFDYIGADASYYIPHREKEGYGLHPAHITHPALTNKIDLIITADCGSGSHGAVHAAAESGIDVIITDHHNISSDIPPAIAVINPKRKDCPSGLSNLAGVGVAFCLLICLRKYLRDKNYWQEIREPNLKKYCDLVALGTVADMVPLRAENRVFSKTGLKLLGSGQRPGLAALRQASGIQHEFTDAEDIAFRLAPRINAAGRMQHASVAVDLLRAERIDVATQLAQSLDGLNTHRRELEQEIIKDIDARLTSHPEILDRRTIVLSHPEWHIGILGIVASKLMHKYYRPVILIAEKDGFGKGSARSIPGIDLYEALAACTQHLETFGGHPLAAGLQLRSENIEIFRQAFEKNIQTGTTPDTFVPIIELDYNLDFSEISTDLMDELESLMPFGTGNTEPLFSATDISVVSSKIIGENHRRMTLNQATSQSRRRVNAIQFNVSPSEARLDRFTRIAFKLRWNRWNGNKTIQMVIEDIDV